MDIKILDFLKNCPSGATSIAVHTAVAGPNMTMARIEDALDDLIKDGLISLDFISGITVYTIVQPVDRLIIEFLRSRPKGATAEDVCYSVVRSMSDAKTKDILDRLDDLICDKMVRPIFSPSGMILTVPKT